MFNRVTSKLGLFCYNGPQIRVSHLRECVALLTHKSNFSTSNQLAKEDKPSRWLSYNDVIYPPQEPGEEKRPAVSTFVWKS